MTAMTVWDFVGGWVIFFLIINIPRVLMFVYGELEYLWEKVRSR